MKRSFVLASLISLVLAQNISSILQNGSGYVYITTESNQRVPDQSLYLGHDKNLYVKKGQDLSSVWQIIQDPEDGLFWIVSTVTEVQNRYMIYLNDPPASLMSVWPYWPDPQTKWEIISNNNGAFWIVSGSGQRSPGLMFFSQGSFQSIDKVPFWSDPQCLWIITPAKESLDAINNTNPTVIRNNETTSYFIALSTNAIVYSNFINPNCSGCPDSTDLILTYSQILYDVQKSTLDFRALNFATSNDSIPNPNSSFAQIFCLNQFDLSGTPFILNPVFDVDPSTLESNYNISNTSQCFNASTLQPVTINKTRLLEKYQFVYDYAPDVWLNEVDWFPSSVNFHADHTHPYNIMGDLWAITDDYLKEPSTIFDFFRGQPPDSNGFGPPVITTIFPIAPFSDPFIAYLNPDQFTMEVYYFFFYPYNRGKSPLGAGYFGNHVGDIEHCSVIFKYSQPTSINCDRHGDSTIKNWDDLTIQMNGTRPVVFSALGSHAVYFESGSHHFRTLIPDIIQYVYPLIPESLNPGSLDLIDECGYGTKWNIFLNLDIAFPWEFISRKFENDSWNGISYLLQIFRWGNPHKGMEVINDQLDVVEEIFDFLPFVKHPKLIPRIKKEYQLDDGPGGFLDKCSARIQELEQAGFVCEGIDPSRCVWPFGIFSARTRYCQENFVYSNLTGNCYLGPYSDDAQCNCPDSCSAVDGKCGIGWIDHCHGSCFDFFAGEICYSDCIVQQKDNFPTVPLHFVCRLDGTWRTYSDFTNGNRDDYVFNSGWGAGSKNNYDCVFPLF